MPVILLRTLKTPSLVNGTRLLILECYEYSIKVKVLNGCKKGCIEFIPMIKLHYDTDFYSFTRLQLPVAPCFAMTINKSQGQTFNKVGIYLKNDVFSHGQLYVALSRITNLNNYYYFTESYSIKNVVHKEVDYLKNNNSI